MSRGRKILVGLLILAAAAAAGYLAYHYVSTAVQARQYRELREQMTVPTDVTSISTSATTAASTTETTPPTTEAATTVPTTQTTRVTTTKATTTATETEETTEPTETTTEPTETAETTTTAGTTPSGLSLPIDFVKLQKINPEIYAWMDIPGTEMSFPLLQDANDINYYLTHLYNGSYGKIGSIFTAPGSAKDFSDYNTVIYGHNYVNSHMFESLKNYRNDSFLRSHRDIIIYTPYSTLTYRVVGEVIYSNVLISSAFNFKLQAGRQKFLDSLYAVRDMTSQMLDDAELTADDHLIVLSTCCGNSAKRFLVIAKLVSGR